ITGIFPCDRAMQDKGSILTAHRQTTILLYALSFVCPYVCAISSAQEHEPTLDETYAWIKDKISDYGTYTVKAGDWYGTNWFTVFSGSSCSVSWTEHVLGPNGLSSVKLTVSLREITDKLKVHSEDWPQPGLFSIVLPAIRGQPITEEVGEKEVKLSTA